jgi:hypothetical protein
MDMSQDTQQYNIWDVLGIETTNDERSIKRAYAKKLKITRPDEDPIAFQLLRDCYQVALRHAAWSREQAAEGEAAPATEQPVTLDKTDTRAPEPPAAEPPEQPQDVEQIWQSFIGSCIHTPLHDVAPDTEQKLQQLFTSDTLLNLELRDAMEYRAILFCVAISAKDEAGEAMSHAMVDFFGWKNDVRHLHRINPTATQAAIERYTATRNYPDFEAEANQGDKAMRYLLADSHPSHSIHLFNSRFVKQIKAHITNLRWHQPEVLQHKINRDVFLWWEQKALQKKYFVQTFLYSIIAGMILTPMLFLPFFNTEERATMEKELFVSFILAQIIGFSAFAAYALIPHKLSERLQKLKERWFDPFIHVHRHQERLQLIWLPPLFLSSLLLFIEQPGPILRAIASGGLCLSAITAAYLHTTHLNWKAYAIALAVAFAFASDGLVWTKNMPEFDYGAGVLLNFTLFLWIIRGSDDYYDSYHRLLRLQFECLLNARIAWLMGFVLLLIVRDKHYLVEPLLAILAWTLFLCGLGLCNMRMAETSGFYKVILGSIFFRIIAPYLPDFGSEQMALLIIANSITAIAICLNVYATKLSREQPP